MGIEGLQQVDLPLFPPFTLKFWYRFLQTMNPKTP